MRALLIVGSLALGVFAYVLVFTDVAAPSGGSGHQDQSRA